MTKSYNFGEKSVEKTKQQDGSWKEMDVWQSPKFKKSREKAVDLIEKGGFDLDEGDFWILMNQGGGKMVYTGLIISHNGCLKINDKLSDNLKFKPLSVSFVRDTGEKEKTMNYINEQQGVYEFGEITTKNCKNDYPYAMVLKRLMDRVILKNSKIGFFGIYSEAESEDFKDKLEPKEEKASPFGNPKAMAGLVKASDEDMKDTLRQKNEEQFDSIKLAIMNLGSLDGLATAWEAQKKELNSLAKYAPDLYAEIIAIKDREKSRITTKG